MSPGRTVRVERRRMDLFRAPRGMSIAHGDGRTQYEYVHARAPGMGMSPDGPEPAAVPSPTKWTLPRAAG